MKLYDEFQDRREDFEILAFHDAKAQDVEDLEEKTASLKSDVWGRDLPFPVLLDNTGETIAKFGIQSFPTIIVIGPDGKVVKHWRDSSLRDHLLETDPKVAKLLKKLKKGRSSRKLAKAIKEAREMGGVRAEYALKTFAEKNAKKKQISKVFDALNEMGGEYSIYFFAGEKGLGAEDKKVRLAAAGALKKHCQNEHLSLLINRINAEEDKDVKEALSEAIQAANKRH